MNVEKQAELYVGGEPIIKVYGLGGDFASNEGLKKSNILFLEEGTEKCQLNEYGLYKILKKIEYTPIDEHSVIFLEEVVRLNPELIGRCIMERYRKFIEEYVMCEEGCLNFVKKKLLLDSNNCISVSKFNIWFAIRYYDQLCLDFLRPLFVYVNSDCSYDDIKKAKEGGCKFVLDNRDKIPYFLNLVNRMKKMDALAVYLKRLFLRREFYRHVYPIEIMRERSEKGITADLESDLGVVKEVLSNPDVKKDTMLDLGCGWGRFTIPLAKAYKNSKVTGIDVSPESIQFAQRQSEDLENVCFREGDLVLPGLGCNIEKESADVATAMWHVLTDIGSLNGIIDALNNIWDALKKDGKFIFDLPDRNNYHKIMNGEGVYKREVELPESDYRDISPEILKEYREHIKKVKYFETYIPTVEEMRFLLDITGFKIDEIKESNISPSEQFPGGFKKYYFVVSKKGIN